MSGVCHNNHGSTIVHKLYTEFKKKETENVRSDIAR